MNKFIQNVRKRLILSETVKLLMDFISVNLLLLLIYSILDNILLLPLAYRKTFYLLSLLSFVILTVKHFRSYAPYRKTENIIRYIQFRQPQLNDELLSAWQLSIGGHFNVSKDLIDKMCQEVESKIKTYQVKSIVDIGSAVRKKIKLFSVLFGVVVSICFLPSTTLHVSCKRVVLSVFSVKWQSWFSVVPGDKNSSFEDEVIIQAEGKQKMTKEPLIFIKTDSGKWKKYEMEFSGIPGVFKYRIEKLTETISYFILWEDIESSIFTITPLTGPAVKKIKITYKYPLYTRLESRSDVDNPNISAVNGTEIKIEALATKELKNCEVVVNSGKIQAKVKKDSFTAGFNVKENGEYYFVMEPLDGFISSESARYTIETLKDSAPYVELLSPVEDLVCAPETRIPLILRVQDDFGISRVEIVTKIDSNEETTKVIKDNNFEMLQNIIDYELILSKLNVKPGQKIQFYLRAWDNNTVSGPLFSDTAKKVIEITDYAKQHENIEASLKEFKDSILNILADQTMAKQSAEKLNTEFSTSTFASLLQAQKNIEKNTQEPVNRLEDLLSKMEEDPYTDISTYSQYKGLKSHLEHLKENAMKEALEMLGDKDIKGTIKKQDEIIASLEKIGLLSDDIWQYQKMKDMLNNSQELQNAGKDLLSQLSDKATSAEMKKTLEKIKDLMEKISNQVSKLPKELPEDFVNSPGVKSLDMQKTRDIFDELAKAVENNDYAKAMELAKELEKNLDSMSKMMDEAGSQIGFSKDALSGMNNKIESISKTLENIISEQKNINENIEKMDNLKKKELFSRQESILAGLAKRQKEVVSMSLKSDNAVKRTIYSLNFSETIRQMQKVLSEFESKRVFNSQKYLENIIKDLVIVSAAFSNKEQSNDVLFMLNEENAIYELLKKPVEYDLGGSDKEKTASIQQKQKNNALKTDDVRHRMEEFLRQNTVLEPEIIDNTYKSAREMDNAADKLLKSDTNNALESGQKALDYLLDSQNSVSNAASQMGKDIEGSGKGKGSKTMLMKRGITGFRTEPVKLPEINEYKPPKEFRQEIMDALKEKYPLEYEKIIKDYFKRLAQ